jgi:hypothetical protein
MSDIFDIMTFDNQVVENVTITTDNPDWTTVNHFATPDRVAGKYKVEMSAIWKLDTVTKSGMLRYSVDGGTTWKQFQSEPKDKTNDNANVFGLTIDHVGGVIDVRIEMTRESGTNAMDCSRCEIIVERKG